MSGGELGGGGGGRSLNKILKCSTVLRSRVFCNIVNNIYLFSLIKTKKSASKDNYETVQGSISRPFLLIVNFFWGEGNAKD